MAINFRVKPVVEKARSVAIEGRLQPQAIELISGYNLVLLW